MLLNISNLREIALTFPNPVNTLRARESRTLDVTVADLDALRSQLVAAQGRSWINFTVTYPALNAAEEATEMANLASVTATANSDTLLIASNWRGTSVMGEGVFFTTCAASDAAIVIAGTQVYCSVDTMTYGVQELTALDDNPYAGLIHGAAYSPAANKFVVVGTAAGIFTSPNGIDWTAREADDSFAGDFLAVCYIPERNLFVAVGTAGEIQTSTNGTDWTHYAGALSTDLYSVAGNGDYIITTTDSPGIQFCGADLDDWTDCLIPGFTDTLTPIVRRDETGTKFFLSLDGETEVVALSLAGTASPDTAWSVVPSPTPIDNGHMYMQDIISKDGVLMMSVREDDYTYFAVSLDDGLTWSTVTYQLSYPATHVERSVFLCFSRKQWVATVSDYGVFNSMVNPNATGPYVIN